ncbi:Metallo-dependent phosphatase [Coccomyxa subellipsoidea C-169]|uniref:Metallo-dependent phosphatase n=1 Tax=Coccomyxa subellipsoidea (strain C-169) TaxID=574566 RepID=I0YPR0_COCSC|nr:Metallo-dependent phosphatase [Coccomyxa subellipsoidea C-169]EIE20379.1 Metallo-dependent phosphatase [Coccomyxa subellipsoidea C-169]|eukprot:XP_005644923.1 Metallo-dependent phosphatase [Coccomyxa subellipsoidea C-169]
MTAIAGQIGTCAGVLLRLAAFMSTISLLCCARGEMNMLGGQLSLEVPSTKLPGTAWFIQISDTHLSKFDHLPDRQKLYGDKAGDLRLFARTVLAASQPGALLITGDLTDGKRLLGTGEQQLQEWQTYRRVLDTIVTESGIPEAAILDLRGNHDAFNMAQRDGKGDFFPAYAAEGRRGGGARIFSRPLFAGPYTAEYNLQEQDKCPVAVLVGVDATPDPGLRGPTNFAGTLCSRDIVHLNQTLANARSQGCSPALVTYGHYPLPVIAEPDTKPWSGQGDSRARTGSLLDVLTQHGVSAYLSGHLHAVFGQRVHRLHRAPDGEHMAELENAAWKDDRRFRVLTFDKGALAFTDFFFHTPTKPNSSCGPPSEHMHIEEGHNISITGVAKEVVVRKHMVVITSPPDARYSPLGLLIERRQLFSEVRALVIPVIPDRSGTKFPVLPQVLLTWTCSKSGKTGQAMMAQVQQGQNLWRAPWGNYEDSCEASDTLAYIQVHALERVYGGEPPPPASSEQRPAALTKGYNGKPWFTTPRSPLPLQLGFMEWLVLHLDWQQAAVRQVLHSVYLFTGPWLAANYLSGELPGFFFMGRVLFRHRGAWRWRRDPDTLRVGAVHYATCVLPLTIWMAAVVSSWRRSGKQRRWPLTPLQAVCLAPIAAFHVLVVYRVCVVSYGWPALLFSPGLAWYLPLATLLLASQWSQGCSAAVKQKGT